MIHVKGKLAKQANEPDKPANQKHAGNVSGKIDVAQEYFHLVP